MFDIANNTEFLTAIGINDAPEETKATLIAGIEDLAEKRLITRLTEVITDEQAEEFGKFTDEQQAYDYLISIVPNFQEIATSVLSDMKNEILMHEKNVVG